MAAKKRNKKKPIKVWKTVLIPAEQLNEDPSNTQRQDRRTFDELKKNIENHGFDENLLVTVNPDGETYTIRSGNHRFRAGRAVGMVEFPCVIRDDWDDVQAALQSVRRNYARGDIDRAAFTAVVNELQSDHAIDLEDIYGGMGFSDAEAFSVYYEEQKKQEEAMTRDVVQGSDSAQRVKMLDDLGLVLTHIFDEYGDTVPHGFIIFPASGKKHMFIQATNALKNTLGQIAARCQELDLNLNTALAGLLKIGLSQTPFLQEDTTKDLEEKEQEATTDPEDNEF